MYKAITTLENEQCLKKGNILLHLTQQLPFKGNESVCPGKTLHANIHSTSVHNSPHQKEAAGWTRALYLQTGPGSSKSK